MSDDSATIALHKSTRQRLENRATEEDHSYEDVVNRLLDETIEHITLEEVIDVTIERYDLENISCINLNHPTLVSGRLGFLTVTIYTGEAETYEDYLEDFGPEHRIQMEIDDQQITDIEFDVMATFDGLHTMDDRQATLIYLSDSVFGASDSIDIDEGLDNFRDKVRKHIDIN